MNAVVLARRLAGLALTAERDRPAAAHWVAAMALAAMALAAEAEPVPDHTREVAFVAGRARVHLHPLPR